MECRLERWEEKTELLLLGGDELITREGSEKQTAVY